MPGFSSLESAKEMATLAGQVLRVTFTSKAWVREAIVESSRAFRVATVPLLIATVCYMLAFGSILLGDVVYQLGAGDRTGPGIYLGLLRELSTWITFMVLAAIVGSALCGDLGARKIREELDALDVLGVDRLTTLIVPRVVAITFVGLVLSLINLLVDTSAVLMVNPITIDQPLRPQIESVFLVMNWYDLAAAAIKNTLLGFFIGIVACQKGLSAKGGAEGVGRAVGQTVVITFFGIWLFNTLYNTGYLTIVPEAIGIRG
ncbi:ABC transporter permease [Paraconexibacter sp.]|uniref:ABC transporter permease n=1 Tax=Paraconexibacter sp. TaxID=2949640 RepID=UPI0035655CD0